MITKWRELNDDHALDPPPQLKTTPQFNKKTPLEQFSFKNETNRLLQTKTMNELVHQMINEREAHRIELRSLKDKLRRKTFTGEDVEAWSKQMLRRFQTILDHERATHTEENKGHSSALNLVMNVNTKLENDNSLLIERINVLEKQLVKETSKRLVESVLLEQSPLKHVVQYKNRQRQTIDNMKTVAIQNAFAFSERSKRKNRKQQRRKLKPIAGYHSPSDWKQ